MELVKIIEVIAITLEDARRVERYGGDRIELVSALTEGGLTPSYSLIRNVMKSVNIPVNVMVRPHSKSFVYTYEEIEMMKEDIKIIKELGAYGVVLGALNERMEICEEGLQELLTVCQDLHVTFHRAVDCLSDPIEGIKILREYPEIKAVLTSGGHGHITDNIEIINRMIEEAKGIDIILGGGLNLENISHMIKATRAQWYHFGTGLRENNCAFGEIVPKKLESLRDQCENMAALK